MVSAKSSCWASSSASTPSPARWRNVSFNEELGAHVAEVLDGCVQPLLHGPGAGGGDVEHRAVAPLAGLRAAAGDQPALDQ